MIVMFIYVYVVADGESTGNACSQPEASAPAPADARDPHIVPQKDTSLIVGQRHLTRQKIGLPKLWPFGTRTFRRRFVYVGGKARVALA